MNAVCKYDVNDDNYFDVAEAIHAFCILWHSGQNSELYSIFSQSEFKPGMAWSESVVEKENEFYSELTEQNVSSWFESLNNYLASK